MPHSSLTDLRANLRTLADPERKRVSQTFFKTGKGQYAEGDVFLGVTVPNMRKLIRSFTDTPLSELVQLLKSPIHEERFCALVLMVHQFERGDETLREQIYMTYLKNTCWINNWDLVDVSAPQIIGGFLLNKKRRILDELADSSKLWERRIAIVATLAFIRAGETEWTVRISEKLLKDKEDLIHKASGWMLREMGKRNEAALRGFIGEFGSRMPRTMLRYAIEKFSERERKMFLRGA